MAWTAFNQQYAAARSDGLSLPLGQLNNKDTSNLAEVVQAAIQAITQNIAMGNLDSPTHPLLKNGPYATELPTQNYYSGITPGTVVPFSIDLLWDGVNANASAMPPGGFPLNFDAYFLNGHFNIDNATVHVIIAEPKLCCYCGDGIVSAECNEQCETTGENATFSSCCVQCQYNPDAVCNEVNLCNPSICDATGTCRDQPVVCSMPDEFLNTTCAYTQCIVGLCVVQCLDSTCCPVLGDNCTEAVCNSNNICEYRLVRECDCSMFNNCIDCVTNNFTSCAHDTASGACFSFNMTQYNLNPRLFYTPGVIVTNNITQINTFCVILAPGSDDNSIIGILIGVIGGTAALVLVGVILWFKVFDGILRPPGGAIGNPGATSGSVQNPLYDNAWHENTNATGKNRDSVQL